jgi:drug/metabolite transporter (DMT)-like permease
MKPMIWIGILLVVVGALVLAYQGIDYTREKNVLDVGSVHLTAETHERLSLPPMLGGLLLIGGVAVLVRGASKKS